MDFIHYIILFSSLLVIASFFCIGLFHSTKGETEIMPNGKERDKYSMLFYPIKKYLLQTEKRIVFYEDFELKKLLDLIKLKHISAFDGVLEIGKFHITVRNDKVAIWNMIIQDILQTYGVISEIDKDGVVKFWKVYEQNIFSHYITNPLIGCFKCYASFWGTLIYLFGVYLAIHTNYIEYDLFVLIPMWIIFCMSLVTVNVLIENKAK